MKLVLGVVRPEIAMDSSSKKWNRCLMRGSSLDSPWTSLGLLKISPDLLVGPKLSM